MASTKRKTRIIRKPQVSANGYQQTQLWVNAKSTTRHISHLVYEAFIGPILPGLVVDHIDGNKSNNHIGNLRMTTQSLNLKGHAKTYGSSDHRGVYYDNCKRRKSPKRWAVKLVSSEGKRIFVGHFLTEEEAALAWNKAASLNGYAKEAMNFISSSCESLG